jgi:predicted membrane protein
VCGFVLTLPSKADKYVLRRIDYPIVKEWRLKHQALLSLSAISLCVAFAVARNFTGDPKDFAHTVNYQESSSAGMLFACCCAAFAAVVLNTLSSLGRRITVRSSHVTGTINDIFLVSDSAWASRCAAAALLFI